MRALLVPTFLLALAVPAGADHCASWYTSAPEVAAAGFYVDNEHCEPDCISYLVAYEESNRIPGLQRSDESRDDTCHGEILADTLVQEVPY